MKVAAAAQAPVPPPLAGRPPPDGKVHTVGDHEESVYGGASNLGSSLALVLFLMCARHLVHDLYLLRCWLLWPSARTDFSNLCGTHCLQQACSDRNQ